MNYAILCTCLALIVSAPTAIAGAEGGTPVNLVTDAPGDWRFITDGVMGGVSSGNAAFSEDNGIGYARMTGEVSTANNGGFIQMRRALDTAPSNSGGVRLTVRGNNQRYFVHLRTSGTRLPWQFYQAGFEVSDDWTEITLPFEAFKPSGGLLRTVPRADSIRSVAIVAYGRDHVARIDVREVAFVE